MKEKATYVPNDIMLVALIGLVNGALVGGIGGRLAMRVVAIIGGIELGFTVSGTMAIMLVGAILGLAGGLVFAVSRPLIPVNGLAKGVAFGLVLALLISLPFFLISEGELGLVPPAIGAALFGAIGLLYGVALVAVSTWFNDRWPARQQRPATLVWVVPILFFLVLAFAGMVSLADEFARFPRAANVVYLALGLDYQQAHGLHSMMMLAFAVAYCGLSLVVFWQSETSHGGYRLSRSVAALALGVLAAGWFRAEPLMGGIMNTLPIVGILPGMVKVGGLVLLVLTSILWPDGRFDPPWTKIVVALWFVWLIVWLALAQRGGLPTQVFLVTTAAGLGLGLLTLALRSRRSPAQRHQIAPVLAGFGLAGAAFLVLWMAALLHPDLQVYRLSLPDTLFVFVPYLLPWLLLPLSLVAASRLGQEDRSRLLETAPESDRSWTGDASVARLSTKQWEAKAERRDAHL